MADSSEYLRWFDALFLEDVPLVGGKNASLGELYRKLSARHVHVPNGFALTVHAYYDALQEAGAWKPLHALLDVLDITDMTALAEAGAEARRIVYAATGTETLRRSITGCWVPGCPPHRAMLSTGSTRWRCCTVSTASASIWIARPKRCGP